MLTKCALGKVLFPRRKTSDSIVINVNVNFVNVALVNVDRLNIPFFSFKFYKINRK